VRTVSKERARSGESAAVSRTSTSDISSGRAAVFARGDREREDARANSSTGRPVTST